MDGSCGRIDLIGSPERLTAHLDSILREDFIHTHRINRQELDETVSALERLLCGDVQTTYPFHPQLKTAFLSYIDNWQNAESGCWGPRYIGRDGNVWQQDDVGITFHIVADRQGNVKHLDRIARRVLELSDVNFPAGIRMSGRYENHLNMDFVRILKYAWPELDDTTRSRARAEIASMLRWCVTESYQADGPFKTSELDDTPGDAMQYGVDFLRVVGYFQKKERFWTQQAFPEARSVYDQIKTRLGEMGLKGPELVRADRRLGTYEGDQSECVSREDQQVR